MNNQDNQDKVLQELLKKNDYRRLIEVRALDNDAENEEDKGKMIIEGKAIAFNERTVLFDDYGEIIDANALDGADLNDVFLKYNHSDSFMVMARTKNNTLKLDIRADGLYITAELADTTAGRDLYELIKRGDIDKMSFAFTIEEESYNAITKTWTVLKIKKMYDVAAVPTPAYENTGIYARRLGDVETLKRSSEELELAKSKVNLRLKIKKTMEED